jgi:hypothetical protein
MTTSGFTAGYLLIGIYFGHQRVRISESHDLIFYSKLTKEHDRSAQNAWISTLSRPKTDR